MNNTNKTFFTVYFGQAVSQLTSSVLQMAIVWYLIAEGASGVIIALSGIMAFLPQGFLGLFVGVYIDRHNRKAIMIWSDLLIAGAGLCLVIAGLFGKPSIALIMLVLALRSVGTAFHAPSLGAVVPLIVPKDELSKYAGYSQGLQSVSLLISPALAAALFAVWDLPFIIMLDVIGAIIAVLCILVVKIPNHKKSEAVQTPNFKAELIDGLAILKKHKLTKFIFTGALFSLFYMPIFVLYPMMTLNYFGKSEWYAGLVEIVFAVGMLIGSFALSKAKINNKINVITLSVLTMAICLVLSGLLPFTAFGLFAVLSAILGLASPFYGGLVATVLGERIEEVYLGRVMSLSGALAVIGTPAGIAISGVLADVVGVQVCFAVFGVLLIAVSAIYKSSSK